MADPTNIPVLDLEVFKGITYALSFQINDKDSGGTITGPHDLTGKVIAVTFNTIFSDPVVLLSSDGPNDLGSLSQINVDPTTGICLFSLSAAQLNLITTTDGKWHMEERNGMNSNLLTRGAVRVLLLN